MTRANRFVDPATPGLTPEIDKALSDLVELRRFSGPPKDFWPRLLDTLARLTAAEHLTVLLQDPALPGTWKKMAEWSSNRGDTRHRVAFTAQLVDLAEQSLAATTLLKSLETSGGNGSRPFAIGARLELGAGNEQAVLIGLLIADGPDSAREALVRLGLAADTPAIYQLGQAGCQAREDVQKFALVLDLLVPIQESKHFLSAALALCNGLSTGLGCARVSLGWIEGGYVRLQALSRTEKFDRQMGAAQDLEAAMDECFEQDEEILWPSPSASAAVTRDHERFAQGQKVGNLCSVPLRIDSKVFAVITCERQNGPFTAVELQQLRLLSDQTVRLLADLKRKDLWFGARWGVTAREQAARWLTPEHTGAKALALGITVLLAALFFVRVSYRVEGNFILRSDEVSYCSAPFDGYIQQVYVRTGDAVEQGAKLLRLNTSELELEQAAALADLTRFQREAEKARAVNALAEMGIAQAMTEQSRARLDLAQYRLENATIKAPFAGAVVEGDLRERIAAPIKQGDLLYKVARLDALYAQAEVNERDVHEILARVPGEIAFVSQPRLKYPVHVIRVEPSALPKKDGNVFLVRLTFDQKAQSWWRPGMSGLCKLDAGKRTLFWILTHRTVDFLRLKLWW